MSNDAMLCGFARTLAAGAIAAALLACGGSSTSPTPQPGTVTATTGLQFTPGTVTVTRNGAPATVTWVFQSTTHNVTFGAQPSGAAVADIPSTQSVSVGRDFSVAGSYPYHCTIHPSMTGTVVVQ